MMILQEFLHSTWCAALGGVGITILLLFVCHVVTECYSDWKKTKVESFGAFKREIEAQVTTMRQIEKRLDANFEEFKKATIERHTDYLNMLERDTKEIGDNATRVLDNQRELTTILEGRLREVEKELKAAKRPPAASGVKKPGRPKKGLKK
jgi:small-conductance mechanosensitive channel